VSSGNDGSGAATLLAGPTIGRIEACVTMSSWISGR